MGVCLFVLVCLFFFLKAFLCYHHLPSSGTCLGSYNFLIAPSVNLPGISMLSSAVASKGWEAGDVSIPWLSGKMGSCCCLTCQFSRMILDFHPFPPSLVEGGL